MPTLQEKLHDEISPAIAPPVTQRFDLGNVIVKAIPMVHQNVKAGKSGGFPDGNNGRIRDEGYVRKLMELWSNIFVKDRLGLGKMDHVVIARADNNVLVRRNFGEQLRKKPILLANVGNGQLFFLGWINSHSINHITSDDDIGNFFGHLPLLGRAKI